MLTWIIFGLAVLVALVIDLGLHSKNTRPTLANAFFWTGLWISLALLFNVWIYFEYGSEKALKFLASYLVEESLSIDNLFVFLIIFKSFHIPPNLRHKVLFWGVIGAIVMRAIFIVGGIALVSHFEFIFYIFGLFLIYTGFKLAFQHEGEMHPEKNPILLWFEKWMPIDTKMSEHFFIKKNQKWFATPLFLALLAVEISDLVFAIDSIPAVLGITTDPMIVYTSNIFAIMGLRSLYFALEHTLDLFHYLHYGLAAILVFIGTKMLIANFYHISIQASLGFIAATLLISIAASFFFKKKPY